jgi:hypothetical protein
MVDPRPQISARRMGQSRLDGGDHHVDRRVAVGVDRQPPPLGIQLDGRRVALSWIGARTITGDRALRPTRWSEDGARSLENCRLHQD